MGVKELKVQKVAFKNDLEQSDRQSDDKNDDWKW